MDRNPDSIDGFLKSLGVTIEGYEPVPSVILELQRETINLIVYNKVDEEKVNIPNSSQKIELYGPVMPDFIPELNQHLYDRGIRLTHSPETDNPEKRDYCHIFRFEDVNSNGLVKELSGLLEYLEQEKYKKPS